eukprot:CAMPEP_0170743882 /NCGR_PEP_ID=MMETSP0437-20130122/7495_1 /TAXON_ID=0 /ORGANISM="Sexangularia sp." /LENGTH=128 /DNA_ID=CAMNT_0011082561 /DNA_START=32 /DNA_END=418 /DNA_ORIENTATION=+
MSETPPRRFLTVSGLLDNHSKKLPKWTAQDRADFAAANPKEGAALASLRRAGQFTLAASFASSVGGALLVARQTKNPLYMAVGGAFSGILGLLIADDIPSLLRLGQPPARSVNESFLSWWAKRQSDSK